MPDKEHRSGFLQLNKRTYQEVSAMFFRLQDFENITPDDLREKMEKGEDFLLLDVRTLAEHAAEAIEGAYLLPIQELGFRINELPRNKEIVAYCRVGNRSAFAASHLARLGYKVKNLEGGIVNWNTTQNREYSAVS
jgi:rhodanese-related sulfurtransferase